MGGTMSWRIALLIACAVGPGCQSPGAPVDAGTQGVADAGVADGGEADAGVTDAGVTDAGVADAGLRPGVVPIVGGDYDGFWTIEGTELCSSNHGCRMPMSASGLHFETPPPCSNFTGEVGDAGPGSSTVSYDGGQVVLTWPTVEGRSFAVPAHGERIFVAVRCPSNIEEPPSVDVYSQAGRLLIASEGHPMFAIEQDPTASGCSIPSPWAECCCRGYFPGVVVVEADDTVRLSECGEADVTLGGQPMHVAVVSAETQRDFSCMEAYWSTFWVGAYALSE